MGDSMSTIINATTTNGVVIQPDNSGSLVLQTNSGTTALTIDTSQRAAFVAGTAALPAITTTGDTNTGIWFPAADTVATSVAGTESMRIDSGGNLLVGTTSLGSNTNYFAFSPSNKTGFLGHANGTINGTSYLIFQYNGTSIADIAQNGTGAVLYNTGSDYRLKENVKPMLGGLAKVMAMNPVTYKWKLDGSDGEGFIAHELQEIVPLAVSRKKDGVDAEGKPIYQGMDASYLVATLTAAIQEQQTIINDLKARVETLEAK